MRQQIFGYTPPGPPAGELVKFVAAFKLENGAALCVRNERGEITEVTLPAPDAAKLGAALVDVERLVQRFLQWKLPEDFHPDNGISFTAVSNPDSDYPYRHKPVGTNLLTAAQAEAMIRHLLATD